MEHRVGVFGVTLSYLNRSFDIQMHAPQGGELRTGDLHVDGTSRMSENASALQDFPRPGN